MYKSKVFEIEFSVERSNSSTGSTPEWKKNVNDIQFNNDSHFNNDSQFNNDVQFINDSQFNNDSQLNNDSNFNNDSQLNNNIQLSNSQDRDLNQCGSRDKVLIHRHLEFISQSVKSVNNPGDQNFIDLPTCISLNTIKVSFRATA